MKNKNVIKAMAIGISASMALQPVTVLAENVKEGETSEESQVNSVSNKTADEVAGDIVERATAENSYVNGEVKGAVDNVNSEEAKVSENDFS